MKIKDLYYDGEVVHTEHYSIKGIEEFIIKRLLDKIEQLEDSNDYYIELINELNKVILKGMM